MMGFSEEIRGRKKKAVITGGLFHLWSRVQIQMDSRISGCRKFYRASPASFISVRVALLCLFLLFFSPNLKRFPHTFLVVFLISDLFAAFTIYSSLVKLIWKVFFNHCSQQHY